MKKSTWASSILVLLGVFTTAGAWFTGKQAEEKYQQFAKQAAQQLAEFNHPDMQIAIKQSSFERGWFSSDIHYQLEINGVLIEGKDRLFHGPFPLNRLSSGNFMPAMFSLENHLSSEDLRLKNIFADSAFFDSQLSMSYGQSLSGNMQLKPMKWNEVLETSALHFEGTLLGDGEHHWQLPSLVIHNPSETVEYKGIELNYENHHNAQYPYLFVTGDYTLKAKQLKTIDPEITASFDDFQAKGHSQIKDGRLVISDTQSADVTISAPNQEAQKVAKLAQKSTVDLEAKIVNELIPLFMDGEESQIQAGLMALLSHAPKFKVDSQLINDKNESLFKVVASIQLKPFELHQISGIQEALNILDFSSLHLSTESSALEKAITQLMQIRGTDSNAQSALVAQGVVEGLKNQAAQSGLAVVDEKGASLDLQVEQGQLTLNKQPYSSQALLGLLMMLMFNANLPLSGH